MTISNYSRNPGLCLAPVRLTFAAVCLFLLLPLQALAFDSFLEPAHQVELVPASREVIEKIHVTEGDRVVANQLLVSLRADVLKARLASAKLLAEAHGKLDAAKVLKDLRARQLEDLTALAAKGNVRPRELDTAQADLAMAEADVTALLEERRMHREEIAQIEAMLKEKEVRSPIGGIVTKVGKEAGELTGNSEQDVLVTVVQPYPLKAVFYLPVASAASLAAGDSVQLQVGLAGDKVSGRIEFVSPVSNPESGTVQVTVTLPEDAAFRSGLRCTLIMAKQLQQVGAGNPSTINEKKDTN